MSTQITIFANTNIGVEIISFLLDHFPIDINAIVILESDEVILEVLTKRGFEKARTFVLNKKNSNELYEFLQRRGSIDYIILAWWPHIIKNPILSLPKYGAINFHPSLLPFNRGKHYNFWNIVEQVPFGVSLHFIDEGIDTGDVLFQKPIETNWEDTGKTLFQKAQQAIVELFCNKYSQIRSHDYERTPQVDKLGSFHFAKELLPMSRIDLDALYTGAQIINLLRAKTFPPYPGCFFIDENNKYEINIIIKKVE